MKFITNLAILLLATTFIFAQSDCKPYVPVTVGSEWEITNYSSKGKMQGRTAYKLVDKSEIAGGITFSIEMHSYDNKDKEIYKNTFEAYCKDGRFNFDMAFRMNGMSMEAYENMEVDVDATDFELPDLDASAGTDLKDAKMVMSIGTNGATMFTMTIEIIDRKIEAREELNTPAGTFDCVKLAQKIVTKTVMTIEGSSKEWYAEEVGMVRNESYDKKGKMMGYSELTKLERK